MLVLIACAVLAIGPEVPPASEVRQAYQEAKAKAGRSSEDQVRLALWCEAHGLTAERLNHLTLAILADPRNATARGLMGLVFRDGRWSRPEVLAEKAKADAEHAATLAEYEAKRLKTPYTAEGQWALGMWADEHGLKDQAKAHLTAVTRLAPGRDEAWKRLGYKKHEGRWVTDAQLATEKVEREAQKEADRKWKSLLEKYKAMLDQPSRREEAEAALAEVTDPRAVPMIGRVFAKSEATQPLAVQLLGQVESPAASRALAFLSMFARSSEARRLATETLRGRDPREYLGLLVGLIRDPIKYEVRPVGGPGSPGELYVEGKKANVRRVYSPAPPPNVALLPTDLIVPDENGLPVVVRYGRSTQQATASSTAFTRDEYTGRVTVDTSREKLLEEVRATPGNTYDDLLAKRTQGQVFVGEPQQNRSIIVQVRQSAINQIEVDIPVGRMMLESQRAAISAQQQLEDDVRVIDAQNGAIKDLNARARVVLRAAIGQDFGDDRPAWDRMWVDRQGYAVPMVTTAVPPTVVEQIPLNYQAETILPSTSIQSLGTTRSVTAGFTHSCFAAGTTVRTLEGDRAIESIRPGDLVLVQDTRSGGLGYQAVITAYHNPPSPTLRVHLGEETVVATGIHRFWKVGKGWTMARDLKTGDLVRTLGGAVPVGSVEDERVQPVFNLEVGEGHSFLVGKLGALVHDNSLVEATPAPFDAESSAVAKGK